MKYDFPMICPVVFERMLWAMLAVMDLIVTKFKCRLWGVTHGHGVRFQGKVFIRTHRRGDIKLGDDVRLNARFSFNPVGLINPVFLDTRAGGRIVIGSHSGFSSVIISSRQKVTIGDYVNVGGNVRIFDHDFHPLNSIQRRRNDFRSMKSSPVLIEDDVFIGTNAIILKGTHIGARSIIAAGSVVFGLDIPPDSLVKGNPAKIVERK